jgi:hypothetical protein
MSFPWSNLITAGSTLLGGFGGIWLKERFDVGRDAGQRRREACAALIVSLDELLRLVDFPATVDARTDDTITRAFGRALGAAQRAYAAVDLIAPRDVRDLGKQAMNAAWAIQRWFDGVDRQAELRELAPLIEGLHRTGTAFLEAARSAAR